MTGQAQGIPLFAVETIRSLIDREIVQPVDGAYRLVGQLGELDVPEGLHALLAARLDALDRVCGGWSPTRQCWALPFRPRRWPWCPAWTRRRSTRAWPNWCAARC